jgi:hypothetical protein
LRLSGLPLLSLRWGRRRLGALSLGFLGGAKCLAVPLLLPLLQLLVQLLAALLQPPHALQRGSALPRPDGELALGLSGGFGAGGGQQGVGLLPSPVALCVVRRREAVMLCAAAMLVVGLACGCHTTRRQCFGVSAQA